MLTWVFGRANHFSRRFWLENESPVELRVLCLLVTTPRRSTRIHQPLYNSLLALHSKEPPSFWHKQQKYIISQFWRLDIQNQGISRVVPSKVYEGRTFSRLLSRLSASTAIFMLHDILPPSAHYLPYVCYLCPNSLCLQRCQSDGIRVHLNDLTLTGWPLWRLCLQVRSQWEVMRVRT